MMSVNDIEATKRANVESLNKSARLNLMNKEKAKCQIVGCENNAEFIRRPEMQSGIYCRKHFDEIYYGNDKEYNKRKRDEMKSEEDVEQDSMDIGWLHELMRVARENVKANKITGDYSLWNILTALRGPDLGDNAENQRLKELTTGRIRGILGIVEDRFYVRHDVLSPDSILERDELLEKSVRQHPISEFQNTHFFFHFVLAMLALRRLGYDIPDNEMDSLVQLKTKIVGI